MLKFSRLALTAATVATMTFSSLTIAPVASALTDSEYSVMIGDFERTYGKNYVAIGAQKARNRCIVPDTQQKTLNPSLYDQQVKERVACEGEMTRLVDTIRKEAGWSAAMDKVLTTLGETYSFVPAIQLRKERRAAHINAFRQQRWSVELEKQLSHLVPLDPDAKYVVDQARKVNRIRVEEAAWSLTVEAVLSPMMPYDSAASTMLKSKRNAYLAQWKQKDWSTMMETALKPMADQAGVPEAKALREAKRRELLNAWVNEAYSQEMESALSELATVYPAAATLLAEKRAGKTAAPDPKDPTTPTDESPAPAPSPSDPDAKEPPADTDVDLNPSTGSSEMNSGELAAAILVPLLLIAGGAAGLYFAWFGI